jgi:hypothetical protein
LTRFLHANRCPLRSKTLWLIARVFSQKDVADVGALSMKTR